MLCRSNLPDLDKVGMSGIWEQAKLKMKVVGLSDREDGEVIQNNLKKGRRRALGGWGEQIVLLSDLTMSSLSRQKLIQKECKRQNKLSV